MIEFEYDPEDVMKFYSDVEHKAMKLAVRSALNKGIKHARKITDKEMADKYGIKRGGENKSTTI